MFRTTTSRVLLALSANATINIVGFGVSSAQQTEVYYDACGSSAFAASALTALAATTRLRPSAIHPLHIALGATTTVWAARLFEHLTSRVHRLGGDSRFDAVKTDPAKFSVYWAIQTMWVGIVSLPAVVVLATPAARLMRFGPLAGLGLGLWATGFTIEAVADKQKADWQNRLGAERKGKFIDEGLWTLARYPNYFGEMTLWTGSYVMAVSALPLSAATVTGFAASPLFITLLLTQLSGIPLQEKQAAVRFHGNAAYAEYVKRTNLLVPMFKFTGTS
ncbi:hypothetical protein HDU78_009556 [Chytriomyces hyalinus]|nr:hypothetical protein HDU78_009556 [Chytriomyces hyalinus]